MENNKGVSTKRHEKCIIYAIINYEEMMKMQRLTANMYHDDWALVTAGSLDDYNTMTISWGGLGTLWSKQVATVYVKPIRYTYQFLEKNDYFTITFFDKQYRKDLGILGSKSGRDGDKVALTKLHAKALENGVTFEEAKITLVCRKIYKQDLDVTQMSEDVILQYYETEAAHRMYVGEVIEIIES